MLCQKWHSFTPSQVNTDFKIYPLGFLGSLCWRNIYLLSFVLIGFWTSSMCSICGLCIDSCIHSFIPTTGRFHSLISCSSDELVKTAQDFVTMTLMSVFNSKVPRSYQLPARGKGRGVWSCCKNVWDCCLSASKIQNALMNAFPPPQMIWILGVNSNLNPLMHHSLLSCLSD